MALSCIISEIKQDIGQKSQFFPHSLHSTFPLEGSCRNTAVRFGVATRRSIKFEYMIFVLAEYMNVTGVQKWLIKSRWLVTQD